MKNLDLIAKGGLLILIIISIGVLIERLTKITSIWVPADFDNTVLPIDSTLPPDVESVLDEKFEMCMIEHSKSPYFPATEKINELLSKKLISIQVQESLYNNNSSPCLLPPGKCIQNLVIDFNNLMKSLDVRLILIEPSVLFCMLPTTGKFSLLTRGFSLQQFKDRNFYSLEGSRNVMTFGIFHTDAKVFEESNIKHEIRLAGFKILKFQGMVKPSINTEEPEMGFGILRYFFTQFDMVIHVIELYPRNTYTWYPGLLLPEISLKNLFFLNNEIFENFTTTTLDLDSLSTKFCTPLTARHFLLETVSSEYIECNVSSQSTAPTTKYLSPNKDAQNNLALTVITELKNIFNPQLVVFWLWGKSLLGWFEKCDVFHYSSELELSIESKSLEILSIPVLFNKSDCRSLDTNLNETNKYQIECHELHVSIFIMQKGKHIVWYEDTKQKTKFTFPKYSLCSTDVLGQKINIPCNTSKLVQSEQGRHWRNVTLKLQEET